MTLTFGQEARLYALRTKRGKGHLSARFSEGLQGGADREALAALGRAAMAYVRRLFTDEPELAEAAQALGGRGWTVPLWLVGNEIVGLAEMENLDGYFTRELRKRGTLARIVRSTSTRDVMRMWLPLYKQAVFLLGRRQHLAAVPVLLLIFEGLVSQGAGERGAKNPPRQVLRQRAVAEEGVLRVLLVSLVAFADAVFGAHPFDTGYPQVVNRHLVLHGRMAPVWTRVDALRLLLAIDAAATVFDIQGKESKRGS